MWAEKIATIEIRIALYMQNVRAERFRAENATNGKPLEWFIHFGPLTIAH